MDIRNPLSTLTATVALALSSLAYSDQISLKNGDILQGTLTSQTDAYVLWESDNFGALQIPTNQIAFINRPDTKPAAINTVEEKALYKGNVGLSGTYLSGNEQRDDLELNIGFTFKKGDSTHNAKVHYETLGQDNKSTINDYGINYGIDWLMSNGWYWGNIFSYGADDKRQIDQSVSFGTNMGYQFWQNDKGKLSTAIGLTWINDKLFSAVTDDRLAWSWSGDYQKQLIREVSLSYSHQLNVSIRDSENTQLTTDVGIIIPVTKKLDTKISWDWSFDNQPEQGNEKIDRKLKFGVDYSL